MGHFSSCMMGKNVGILSEVLRCTNIYMLSPLTDTHPSAAAALPRRSFTLGAVEMPQARLAWRMRKSRFNGAAALGAAEIRLMWDVVDQEEGASMGPQPWELQK
jgi:hypothetical protein